MTPSSRPRIATGFRTRPVCHPAAAPSDVLEIDLGSYKGLVPPWNDWAHLVARGRHWAGVLAAGLLGGGTR